MNQLQKFITSFPHCLDDADSAANSTKRWRFIAHKWRKNL